jgi:hypothetical protein
MHGVLFEIVKLKHFSTINDQKKHQFDTIHLHHNKLITNYISHVNKTSYLKTKLQPLPFVCQQISTDTAAHDHQ